MFRVLILWVHSIFLFVIFISFLLMIMCLNGLRRKPHILMMLRLFWIFSGLTYLTGLESIKLSLVIATLIFAIIQWKHYSTYTIWLIRLPQPITLKWMAKLKFQIEKSSPFWIKQCNLTGEIGVYDLVMYFDLIGLLTNHL